MDLQLEILQQLEEEEEELTALLFSLISAQSSRLWVHPINEDRSRFGEFNRLMPQLLKDEERFLLYFRMTITDFYHILNLVAPGLRKCCTQLRESVSPEERLAVCLRYLATGNSFRSLGFSFRLGFSTVGKIVKECCQLLWEILQPVYMPEPDENRWMEIAKAFETKWNYPHCIGALDGKHIQIRCPHGGGSLYFNYKGTHSIVLLALVDADNKFILIDVGAYGRSSDGGTFERSSFGRKLEDNRLHIPRECKLTPTSDSYPFVIVADEAFPLKPNLMRPFSRNSLISDEEKIYNYRHSRARLTVENAFGILAGRWQIFLKPIETQPETADYIVLAACCLHNLLRSNSANKSFENRIQVESTEVFGLQDMGGIRRNYVREAGLIRDKFKKYFISPQGAAQCPWQWESIRKGRGGLR